MFNHESPQRGENFISKTTKAVAEIALGKEKFYT